MAEAHHPDGVADHVSGALFSRRLLPDIRNLFRGKPIMADDGLTLLIIW